MNFFFKQKLWFFIALFFIIVTIVLLTGMFMHRGSKHFRKEKYNERGHFIDNEYKGNREQKRNPKHFTQLIIDSLKFTSEQQNNLQKINEEMELNKDSLFEKNEKCKALFTEELYSGNSNKNRLDSLMKCISYNTEKYNQLRIDNMDKLHSICNVEQKKKLPIILKTFISHHQNRKRGHH